MPKVSDGGTGLPGSSIDLAQSVRMLRNLKDRLAELVKISDFTATPGRGSTSANQTTALNLGPEFHERNGRGSANGSLAVISRWHRLNNQRNTETLAKNSANQSLR